MRFKKRMFYECCTFSCVCTEKRERNTSEQEEDGRDKIKARTRTQDNVQRTL